MPTVSDTILAFTGASTHNSPKPLRAYSGYPGPCNYPPLVAEDHVVLITSHDPTGQELGPGAEMPS